MGKEILTFGDIEIKKKKKYHNKISILLKYVDIEKVIVPNKISFGEKKTKNTLLITCIMVIKLALIQKKSLIACLSKIKNF